MPSREEIVDALKEAVLMCKQRGLESKAAQYDKLASQVESIRCSECKWYPRGSERCQNDYVPGVIYPGPDFGCWHFERRKR